MRTYIVPWLREPKPRSCGYREKQAFFEDASWTTEEEKVTRWFFYPKRGRFCGYSATRQYVVPSSNTSLGSAGPDGFLPPSARSRCRFPPPVAQRHQALTPLYRSESEVYWVDFQARQVRLVFAAPQGQYIAKSAYYGEDRENRVLIRMDDDTLAFEPEKQRDIYLLTSGNHLVFTNLDKGVLAEINLTGILAPGEVTTVGRVSGKPLYLVQTNEEIITMSEDGRIQARYQLPNTHGFSAWSPVQDVLFPRTPANAWDMAHYCWKELVLPSSAPPFVLVIWDAAKYAGCPDLLLGYGDFWLSQSACLRKMVLGQMWYGIGPGLAVALVALLFCNRRLRKYPFSRGERVVWRLLMFLIGPGALLALYTLYDWPAKEPCPACGKKRVVNRENCEFCGAPFTPPAPTGKEIFETADR